MAFYNPVLQLRQVMVKVALQFCVSVPPGTETQNKKNLSKILRQRLNLQKKTFRSLGTNAKRSQKCLGGQ